MIEIQTQVRERASNLPGVDEVRDLYAAAAGEPPLSESADTAALYASIYETSRLTEDLTVISAREDGHLVGFAHGHPWAWARQDYPWAHQLRERLGAEAARIDGSWSLGLLARDPGVSGNGIGRAVLQRWLEAIDGAGCWLQTVDNDTPAHRLYTSLGFHALGHGPEAPNGAPGLVLFRPASR